MGFMTFVIVLLVAVCGVILFYTLRFADIIFMLEDDLDEAIVVHERTVAVLQDLVRTPYFSDSPELVAAIRESLKNVQMCQTATQKLINNFTQRSKQRYVRLAVDTKKTEEEDEAD